MKKVLDEKAIIHQFKKWNSVSAVSKINNTTDGRVKEILIRNGFKFKKGDNSLRQKSREFWGERCVRCKRSRGEMYSQGFSTDWIREKFFNGICRSCSNSLRLIKKGNEST